MKKIVFLLTMAILLGGCGGAYSWHWKLQNGYFDEAGNRAGYSVARSCTRQGMKEAGYSYVFGDYGQCAKDPRCRELTEICIKGKGFIEAITFESTEERMALYRKAYEESRIKPGMTRLEVINLIGAPQIATLY